MINRNTDKEEFILSKDHNLNYLDHTYFMKNICIKRLLNYEIKKEDWDSDKIRNSLFKYYFSINKDETEEKCKLFFKQYLRDIFQVNDKIEQEI